jgi:hypothetical protein
MICPTGAISCDWERFLKDFGEKIGVVLGGNALENAAQGAIASGRLRMLVPKEQVRWDRLFFKVHNKHPRFKISQDK